MKNKTKQNQRIKKEFNSYIEKEEGVTLVALIVTIIILVIISAVSIMAVYNSRIVEHAINGTQGYATEGINENTVLEGTKSSIDSTVNKINDIVGGKITEGLEPEESKPEEPTPPEPTGLTAEELAQEEMIGKYVDYKPDGADYNAEGKYSGVGNKTIEKDNEMKWRIWGVEDNKLLLISENVNRFMQLNGYYGYNNGVKLLNDACSSIYGNPSYGEAIKVRSINMDDIDKVTNMTTDEQRKKAYSEYGKTGTPSYKHWPDIYEQEPGKAGGGTLDRSEQEEWVSGSYKSSSFTGTQTYYKNSASNAINPMHGTLLYGRRTNGSNVVCWVATRCVTISGSYAGFCLFGFGTGNSCHIQLYQSDNGASNPSKWLRPMVEINLATIIIGDTGSGTDTEPYSMVKK